jgi:hypothetical protein
MHGLARSPVRPMPKARRPRWRALELALQYPAATEESVHEHVMFPPHAVRPIERADSWCLG